MIYGADWAAQARNVSPLHRAWMPADYTTEVSHSGNAFRDGVIRSWSTTRGSGNAEPSLNISTAEVAATVDTDIGYGSEFQINVKMPKQITAVSTAQEVRLMERRFSGVTELQDRTVVQTNGMRDRATSHTYAVGTLKQVTTDGSSVMVDRGGKLSVLWDRMHWGSSYIREMPWYAGDMNDAVVWTEDKDAVQKRSDVIKWFTDINMYILNTRWGDVQIKSVPQRIREANELFGSAPPVIETFQAKSGLQQKQEVAINPSVKYPRVTMYDTKTKSWPELYWEPNWSEFSKYGITAPVNVEEEDWRVFGFPDMTRQEWSHAYQSYRAALLRQLGVAWRIPELSFDILQLIRPSTYSVEEREKNHRLAALVVLLEEGAPIKLGSSFGKYSGVHFVTGIKESMTPDAWTFTLSLSPREYITGELIEPRTWDKAPFPWNSKNMTVWSS